ncbi:MAG: aminoglycoside phosphotransferase family protein [Alphaproteobacteria bacterium]|nr:aminoglycoside phosphotransferase family protein [Alphaproteobacteria bacterium]
MDFLTPETANDIHFIGQILAQNGLTNIQKITRLQSGSRSVAYFADDYIVRFPKAEIIWQTMQREKTIIDTIYPHLMPYFANKIHKIELIDGKYPFSVSERFYGKICDGRPESEYAVLYQNLTAKQRTKPAQDIALFFHLMHQIDYKSLNIPEPTEAIDNWDVTIREDFDFEAARQMLLLHGIDLNDYKVALPNTEKALCHNDLSGSNILLDDTKDDILAGIIDFGNVVVMPKYQDFFPLYKIDRKLAIDTLKEYNGLTNLTIEQKQTDYMVLAYIGYGLYKTKDNPSPYFMKLLKPFL